MDLYSDVNVQEQVTVCSVRTLSAINGDYLRNEPAGRPSTQTPWSEPRRGSKDFVDKHPAKNSCEHV